MDFYTLNKAYLRNLLVPYTWGVAVFAMILSVPQSRTIGSGTGSFYWFESRVQQICNDWLHESRVTLGTLEICLTEPTYRVKCGTRRNRW